MSVDWTKSIWKYDLSEVNNQSLANQVGGLKITKAIQQTQERKRFPCFSSAFCLHFVRFTSRENKEKISFDLKRWLYVQI